MEQPTDKQFELALKFFKKQGLFPEVIEDQDRNKVLEIEVDAYNNLYIQVSYDEIIFRADLQEGIENDGVKNFN